mgnify:CR=1 FL=1
MTVTVEADGSGVITETKIKERGTGYSLGDVITISGGGNQDATVTVVANAGGV